MYVARQGTVENRAPFAESPTALSSPSPAHLEDVADEGNDYAGTLRHSGTALSSESRTGLVHKPQSDLITTAHDEKDNGSLLPGRHGMQPNAGTYAPDTSSSSWKPHFTPLKKPKIEVRQRSGGSHPDITSQGPILPLPVPVNNESAGSAPRLRTRLPSVQLSSSATSTATGMGTGTATATATATATVHCS